MTEKLTKITLPQLKLGMYVVSIVNPKKNINIKSEGYISSQTTIEKLKKSGIKHLTIDASKTKKESTSIIVDPPKEKPNKTELPQQQKVSFSAEMNNAKVLYNDAKVLQKKLLHDISKDKQLDMETIHNTTNAIVDSVFKNEDALACLSRLRVKDEYLIEHSLNVAILMSIFAKHLKVEKVIIEQLALGAFLHDIGKIKVPDTILHKPGKFTDDEYEQMKKHVEYGVEIISQETHISAISHSVVKLHHERVDGNGYPSKVPGEELDSYARMIAIVDSYDAMTADRVYKKGMAPIKAFKILRSEDNTGYDKELVEQFIQCLGIYPVGTLVKLASGKLGLISALNNSKPLNPFVKVFYNARLNQAIPIKEIDLSLGKHHDQIESCIRPEDFSLNLLGFFKMAFIDQ
ncbi:HD-GYP domain-containing protein [Cognaticolwellia mytili]|uniref:HD-GYP domain-containing protein n=1 Tax=Cognaticolwellia mytili TaxID=1888913 RepID=UPI000A171D68|nr:HD-GYP domain-containing protein [Cognaticolwellia mytili]